MAVAAVGAVAVACIDAVAFGLTTGAGLYGFTEWEVVTSGALLYAEMAMRLLSLLLVGMLSGPSLGESAAHAFGFGRNRSRGGAFGGQAPCGFEPVGNRYLGCG